MASMDELKRLEADLGASEELRKKFDEMTKRVAAAETAASDGELMVAVAAELGYDISVADLERASAEQEELDEAELDAVAGGLSDSEDEHGHDILCLTAWHCLTALLRTDSNSHQEACWENYMCFHFSEGVPSSSIP